MRTAEMLLFSGEKPEVDIYERRMPRHSPCGCGGDCCQRATREYRDRKITLFLDTTLYHHGMADDSKSLREATEVVHAALCASARRQDHHGSMQWRNQQIWVFGRRRAPWPSPQGAQSPGASINNVPHEERNETRRPSTTGVALVQEQNRVSPAHTAILA